MRLRTARMESSKRGGAGYREFIAVTLMWGTFTFGIASAFIYTGEPALLFFVACATIIHVPAIMVVTFRRSAGDGQLRVFTSPGVLAFPSTPMAVICGAIIDRFRTDPQARWMLGDPAIDELIARFTPRQYPAWMVPTPPAPVQTFAHSHPQAQHYPRAQAQPQPLPQTPRYPQQQPFPQHPRQ